MSDARILKRNFPTTTEPKVKKIGKWIVRRMHSRNCVTFERPVYHVHHISPVDNICSATNICVRAYATLFWLNEIHAETDHWIEARVLPHRSKLARSNRLRFVHFNYYLWNPANRFIPQVYFISRQTRGTFISLGRRSPLSLGNCCPSFVRRHHSSNDCYHWSHLLHSNEDYRGQYIYTKLTYFWIGPVSAILSI